MHLSMSNARGQGSLGPMTRSEAEAECRRLANESPDRRKHRWVPREDGDGGWSVVRIGLPPQQQPSATETRADERPATPDDPRPSTWQNVPPWAAGA
jgi:hypothetical protein